MNDQTQTYAQRIRKLLDKAESTDSPAEAEALTEKAYELMERYAIDEALIHGTREKPDEIMQKEFEFAGTLGRSWRRVLTSMAYASDCLVVIYDNTYRKPYKFTATATGYESDLERLEMLHASVSIQAMRALKQFERDHRSWSWLSKMDKFKERREFIESFASGLASKLRQAKTHAVKVAAEERAAQTGESVADTKAGVDLALRDRKENVRDWYDRKYGNGLRSVRSRHQSGSSAAGAAGYNAGRSADTGTTRVGGGRRAIGR